MIFPIHVFKAEIKYWRGILTGRKRTLGQPFLYSVCVTLQLIHQHPEDRCWFFLGLVLFQHSARQLTGQLFSFGSLVCELSYGDYTWQAVRNWTVSSGKQGSATHLTISANSKHADNNKKMAREYRQLPLSFFYSLLCFLLKMPELFFPDNFVFPAVTEGT